MKKIIYIILLLFFSIKLSAQEKINADSILIQQELIDNAISLTDSIFNIKPIEQLLNSQAITIKELKVELLINYAHYLAEFNGLYSPNTSIDTIYFIEIVNKILECYNLAIKNTEWLTKRQYMRYSFLKDLVYLYGDKMNDSLLTLYKRDLNQLKAKGLNPSRQGLGLGVFFIKGKEKWLGVDFSFMSIFKPVIKFEGTYLNEQYIFSPTGRFIKSANLLTLGYAKLLESDNSEISFSLIEVNSPMVFIPAKFGFQFNTILNDISFFYRPVIGISWGPLSISYSYNFMLSKQESHISEKHLCYIKITYPITNASKTR